MGKRRAREDEVAAAAAAPRNSVAKKRRRRRTRGSMCDDVLRSIFARVPARTAVASMALSKHHRRLAPPLPHPHVAYVATAKVRRSGGGGARDRPVSGYLGFHLAGGGGVGGSNAPMRALAGPACLGKSYVNTCNGVVLLAGKPRPSTCVLWNPAVSDDEKEVTVPVPDRDDPVILGLGYGPKTQSYKLLLTRRQKLRATLDSSPPIDRSPKELLVYDALGSEHEQEQPRLRTLPSKGLDGEIIRGESLYMDGKVYLLRYSNSAILAFDVDAETVTTTDLPGEREPWRREAMSGLMVLSGRPCVAMHDLHSRALWLLTAEHRWEMRCAIDGDVLDRYSLAGVWDCGGVLLMYLQKCRREDGGDDKFLLYRDGIKKKVAELNLPISKTPELSDYALCWGYKPTLVSPGSIVGEVEQGEGEGEERCRDRTVDDIMAALKPVDERHRRVGQEATLDTVCFMEFLLRIMRALPENMRDVIRMPLLKPEDAESGFHSDSDSSAKDGIYHSDSDSDSDELSVDD
ncbi:unnamed protein product [Urochloa humidicola]